MSQNYQYLPPMGVGQPGSVQTGAQSIPFRSQMDARLSGMAPFIPGADYPDGYLGTLQSRREDRFLNSLKDMLNQRSYQRGVHKGERLDPADYLWPPELAFDRGLQREAQAVPMPDNTWASLRNAPLGTVAEQMVVSGATRMPMTPRGKMRPTPSVYDTDPGQASMLRSLAPAWR